MTEARGNAVVVVVMCEKRSNQEKIKALSAAE
jgi:hypothetical protein